MTQSAKPIELTDQNFQDEVLASGKTVLVDFWAGWCAPCHQIAPIIEELAEEFDDRAKVGKLNVDENPGTAQEYGVRSIPTLLLFKNGEVQEQVVGAIGKRSLHRKLEKLVGQPA